MSHSDSYSPFANPDFDPNDYANAVLAGEPYPSVGAKGAKGKAAAFGAGQDVSVAISKLSFSIEDVEKQLKNVVTTHHEALLVQAAGVAELEGSLSAVRGGLSELDGSLDKLRQKIRVPHRTLEHHIAQLERVHRASDLLRRTARFVTLARRLGAEGSADANADDGETERGNAKAALSIAELMALLDAQPGTDEVPLSTVNAVAARLPAIDAARTRVTRDMEAMVVAGLATLDQSLLASSLQTAHNLRVLPELVQGLVADLSDAVEGRIRSAFDMGRISKEAAAKEPSTAPGGLMYKSRVRTEPTSVTAPQWATALWNSLDSLVEEMASCCVKVYILEKVLTVKKDAASQVLFLDEAMKALENRPSAIFWTSLARSLEKQSRDAAKGSAFLQQTLSTGYPRLLRLFHSFFAKIAVQTDTVYTQTQQSPETVLVLRALSNFESLYLSRASNRLNEVVGQAFAGGPRSPPGMAEGLNIARTAANELDAARFDPLLVKSIAKYVAASVDMLVSRTDGLASRERAAVQLLGPAATPQQVLNGQLATCLYHCWARLDKLPDEYPEAVVALLRPSIANVYKMFERIVDPLLGAIRRELGAIIAKLHRMDFGEAVMGGGAGPYMKELVEKLGFVKAEVLAQFNIPDVNRQWVTALAQHVIQTFVLHASIAKPLGESGKLQLASDMAELEFGLSAFMADKAQSSKRGADWEPVSTDYHTLRAMRPLLFLDNAQLASPQHTAGLPPLIVLHHILVRSPITLPHTLHGWAEAEYVRWVQEHTAEEACSLVESDLAHWEKVAEAEGRDTGAAAEYVALARAVLQNAATEK